MDSKILKNACHFLLSCLDKAACFEPQISMFKPMGFLGPMGYFHLGISKTRISTVIFLHKCRDMSFWNLGEKAEAKCLVKRNCWSCGC